MLRKKPHFFYKKTLLSTLLLPLSWMYTIIFAILNIRFSKSKKICDKLICVGNIIVGGSGKTPICCELCEVFNKYFKDICFISKGYGRSENKPLVIPCKHNKIFAKEEVGDEAMLLSEKADVFVVNKRSDADCREHELAICDDGYFDKTIYKNCNIAIFDGTFFTGNGRILPAGPMRSSLKSIKYADFVIITNPQEKIEKQKAILTKYIPSTNILTAEQNITSKHDKNKTYFAFAGIGENAKFTNTLKSYGIKYTTFISFEDHCKYNKNILQKLETAFQASQADKMITTEKDFIKLPKEFCEKNNVECLKIKYTIKDVDKIVSFIIQDV